VADRVELRIAPAIETLHALPQGEYLDFAFIDADKEGYSGYYAELLARLRPGGVIAIDNVFQKGTAVDSLRDEIAELGHMAPVIVHAFNEEVASDTRVDSVMLPIADGLTLVRKH
jgi:caffeoyl-CoA O-methyltransferase